jgi:serine/threonine protein kinase/Leucine-rich repeat (LRR) protein
VIVRQGSDVLARHLVEPGTYVLGRDEDAQIVIDGIDGISRHHAQITVYHDHTEIADLGSSNGTFVNGARVKDLTRLWPNQKIRLGEATIELHRLKLAADETTTFNPHAEALREVLPEEFLREKKYDIGGVVAQGGMGAILNAHEATTGRVVAMKVMLENPSPQDLLRFITEAKVTAQLEHPNIVPVYELSVDENDQVFYTMKFVRGITLHTILDLIGKGLEGTIRKYPLSNLLTVFQKTCDALAFAHSKGIIHRDLKPANIMIGDFGEVMVMDWGLAKILGAPSDPAVETPAAQGDDDADRTGILRSGSSRGASSTASMPAFTMAGYVMGTPQFMAPEQARGEVGRLDARSDIYALGAILYNILTLAPHLDGDDPQAVLKLVKAGHTTPLKLTKKYPHLPGSQIPPSLAAVVRKAMAPAQEARYQNVAELQADLAAYQNGFATSAERAGFWKQTQLFLRRNKAAAVTALVLFAIVVAFTLKVFAEGRRAEQALTNLRAAAPTLIAQGRELVDQQKFEEALDKISFAIQIDPKNAEYHLLRGHVLESVLRLSEAAAEFRQTLAFGPNDSASANLALCERLLRDNKGKAEIDREGLKALHELIFNEQRLTEDAPIAERLGLGRAAVDGRIQALFALWRQLAGWEKRPENERFHYQPDGTVYLSIRGLPIEDLTPLKGLPITNLEMADTRVRDLSPLAGMRLVYLVADANPNLTDLRALKGMPLEHASFAQCKALRSLAGLEGAPLRTCYFQASQVDDLSPLEGAPLQIIDCGTTPIKTLDPLANSTLNDIRAGQCILLEDISAVRSMRWLQKLHIENDLAIRDLSPIGDCAGLEDISLPAGPPGLQATRSLQNLRWIIYDGFQYSPEEFWIKVGLGTERDRQHVALMRKVRQALSAGGAQRVNTRDVKVLADDTLDIIATREELKTIAPLESFAISSLDISNSNVTDLTPLVKMPLRRLKINATRIPDLSPLAQCPKLESLWCSRSGLRDLSPLSKLPLTELIASGNSFTDLSKLAGVPLKVLRIDNTPVTDLQPLLSCPTLEWVTIPSGAKNPGVLRSLPKLVRLSEQWDDRFLFFGRQGGPLQPAAEYWKQYDAKNGPGGVKK